LFKVAKWQSFVDTTFAALALFVIKAFSPKDFPGPNF
jgi:hypothetical protein